MYYFRADGNAVTGAGHLMRCLTIAEELKKLSEADEICFLCADEASAELVTQRGFAVRILHTDYRNMEEELPVLGEVFGREQKPADQAQWMWKAPVILVDSYHVTDAYLEALRLYGRVYLMDDMGKNPYPVDGVINYNAFADKTYYENLYRGRKVVLAIGSEYVPVRPQFLNVPYEVREQVKEVLITTGGGDHDNIAAAVLETIQRPGCHYHVIVGQFNPYFSRWKQLELENDLIHVHHNVTDMASLMRQCDLAVTAGGTTIYELAAIGVPFLCFSYAENQEALTTYIGTEKIAGYCGAYHLKPQETLSCMSTLAELMCEDVKAGEQDTNVNGVEELAGVVLRRKVYQREKEMIDGLGAGRIAKLLAEK
ncbi:MAG: UDP-2,4-diacetamido-2,4,6-trideoxy-beta-L-altropyranose hydrolase [Lachnospiraceae bacterium]|nr:UDP-2,4-diacetamido-2,4,6-trideoxy-beta-L-altropyranose hydrolase [Lachnospiraceae bacterium]